MELFKIIIYVPHDYKERVKEACFSNGAGKIGQYEHCAFETSGFGQFRPLGGARPFLGEVGEVQTVEEIKVEMVCEKKYLTEVLRAMKDAHPYEEPAFDVFKMDIPVF